MRRPTRDAGFTLVEMLVSLALLAMAAALVAQGLASDRGALRRIEAHTASSESVAAAQDLIRGRIERLFPQTQFDSAGPHVDLDGSTDEVEFLSAVPDQGGEGRIEKLRLGLGAGGELTLTPVASAAEGMRGGRAAVLLRGVRTMELAYYGAGPRGAPPAWRPSWSRRAAPPDLVRMRVGFLDSDRREWPELIVRPAVTVDTACALDLETALCRGRR